MEKKIIALACVMLLLVSCFVACGKKPMVKGKNGMEYVMVTDKEGNSVANENGDIAVYVTDAKGKYVKDANGERQTNYIEFPEKIIKGNTFENRGFAFTMPKGWTLEDNGSFVKDGSDRAVTLECRSIEELGQDETLDTVSKKIRESNDVFMNEIKEQYPDASFEATDMQITINDVPAYVLKYLLKDAAGEVFYHANATYFISNGYSYALLYICTDENYNDIDEDLLTYINEGLTVKG